MSGNPINEMIPMSIYQLFLWDSYNEDLQQKLRGYSKTRVNTESMQAGL